MNFLAVELARTGKFDASTGPVELTEQDFNDIQMAYEGLKGRVMIPIKLGHDDDQTLLTESGLPAAGWVENVRRVKDRLVADLMNVHEPVAKLIHSGALRTRSIEAIRNVTLAGKKWKFALTGLALLGAELPAVDSLEDITALYASGKVVVADDQDGDQTVIVKLTGSDIKADPNDPEVMIEELRALIGRIAATTAGKRGAPRLRQLLSVAVDELRRVPGSTVRSSTNKEDDLDIAVIRTKLGLAETATEDEVLAALDKFTSTDKEPAPTEADKSELATLKAQLTATTTDLAKLQNKMAQENVTAKVDGAIKARRFMPASRDTLIKLALADEAAFDELVKATAENTVMAPERGTTAGADSLPAEVIPSEMELRIAAQTGLSREDLIKSKARDLGIELPPAKEPVKV